jgi:hypothetical protein
VKELKFLFSLLNLLFLSGRDLLESKGLVCALLPDATDLPETALGQLALEDIFLSELTEWDQGHSWLI